MLNISIPHFKFRAPMMRLLARVLPASFASPQTEPAHARGDSSRLSGEWDGSQTAAPANTVVDNNPMKAVSAMTPIEWLSRLSRDTSLVLHIDQPTCQVMGMVAVSRKEAAELCRNPIYTDGTTQWQTVGQKRLIRLNFTAATAFQQQEDALNALESLESARFHASSHLARLDKDILQAFESLIAPAIGSDGAMQSGVPVLSPSALSDFATLLASRKITSDELARIDGEAIPALQRLGMPLPINTMPAPS